MPFDQIIVGGNLYQTGDTVQKLLRFPADAICCTTAQCATTFMSTPKMLSSVWASRV